MKKLLQAIRHFFGGQDTPTAIQVAQEAKDSPEHEPLPPPAIGPDADGWYRRPNGEKFRPVKGFMGSGVFADDDPPTGRRRIVAINDPFEK